VRDAFQRIQGLAKRFSVLEEEVRDALQKGERT